MQNVRAITFDLDDTLWPMWPVISRAEACLRDWLTERYPRITERYDSAAALALRQQVALDNPARRHDLMFLRHEMVRRMAEDSGHPELDVGEAFAVFDKARNEVELFADARPALEKLRQHYRLVALTNGNASLERIGIDDLFDGYINAQIAGAAKPDRVIFEAALALVGVSAAETLHVGDQPEMDVSGARAAGLGAVWINRDSRAWPDEIDAPDYTVTDLFELERLLAAARG